MGISRLFLDIFLSYPLMILILLVEGTYATILSGSFSKISSGGKTWEVYTNRTFRGSCVQCASICVRSRPPSENDTECLGFLCHSQTNGSTCYFYTWGSTPLPFPGFLVYGVEDTSHAHFDNISTTDTPVETTSNGGVDDVSTTDISASDTSHAVSADSTTGFSVDNTSNGDSADRSTTDSPIENTSHAVSADSTTGFSVDNTSNGDSADRSTTDSPIENTSHAVSADSTTGFSVDNTSNGDSADRSTTDSPIENTSHGVSADSSTELSVDSESDDESGDTRTTDIMYVPPDEENGSGGEGGDSDSEQIGTTYSPTESPCQPFDIDSINTMAPFTTGSLGGFETVNVGGSFYYIFMSTVHKTYNDARAHCQSMNGYLLHVDSLEVYAAVRHVAAGSNPEWYFIGANDIENEGVWLTDKDNEPLPCSWNWKHYEPDDYNSEEDCATINTEYLELHDSTCFNAHLFICQYDLPSG